MIDYFIANLRLKKDTDFMQSLINCFLRSHYDILIDDESLMERLKVMMAENSKNQEDLEDLLNHNICMISHFVDIQL